MYIIEIYILTTLHTCICIQNCLKMRRLKGQCAYTANSNRTVQISMTECRKSKVEKMIMPL